MSEARLDDAHQDSHQGRHQGGGYRRVELIIGEARRRPWSAEEKARILAESFQDARQSGAAGSQRGVALRQAGTRRAVAAATSRAAQLMPPCRSR
jgi:transposase